MAPVGAFGLCRRIVHLHAIESRLTIVLLSAITMKFFRLLVPLAVALIALVASSASLHAQEGGIDTSKATIADTLGSTLLNEFDKEFDVVFKSVRKGLESAGYVVNYASKKRHLIE